MPNGPAKPATGIITRKYKSGSIIYFEGDRSESIYILKQGRVILTMKKVEKGDIVETKEHIKTGEFFGVKSALGKYPRDETAQTSGDTMVLVLGPADFERLVIKNLNIVKKMLRVFSNQLRRIGRMVREVLGEGGVSNPDFELFKIGEHYYKVGRHDEALYAYKRYMEYYPDSEHSAAAMKRIDAITSGTAEADFGSDFDTSETVSADSGIDDAAEAPDMTDFSIDEQAEAGSDDPFDMGGEDKDTGQRSPLAGEMDDFLSDDEGDDSLDDFSFDEPDKNEPAAGEIDITSKYYDAMNLFSQGSYGESLKLYQEILNLKTLKDSSEKNFYEKAHFEIGRCHLKLENPTEALASLSAMIKKFPKSESVKNALFHIGMAFEMMGKKDKAIIYYTKVASIEPKDQINKQAMKRITIINKNQG